MYSLINLLFFLTQKYLPLHMNKIDIDVRHTFLYLIMNEFMRNICVPV